MTVNHLLKQFILESLENSLEQAIEEKATEPEFKSVETFVTSCFDNDDETFDFTDLHALARSIHRQKKGTAKVAIAPEADVKALRTELEGYGLQFQGRQVQRKTRGHLSNAHGTHPFANSGSGGSGFGDAGFTGHGGGPGAVGSKVDWNADDPRNLRMNKKR
jgi:hypothetical protein